MDEDEALAALDQEEQERRTFGQGTNRVTIPLTDHERGMLESIAAGWGVSVPVASRRLLLLAANVTVI